MGKADFSGCKGCWYLGRAMLGYKTCDYLLIEEHMRGCPIAPGCPKKRTDRRRIDEEAAARLYAEKKTDAQIALRLNVSTSTVTRWRERAGLRPITATTLRQEQYLELYNQGLTDREIAAKVGVVSQAVCTWRNRHGYPCHTKEAAK